MASTANTANYRSVLRDEPCEFAPGKVFQLSGRLCVTFFTDEEQCLRKIRENSSHYYFSNACPTVRAPPLVPASSSTQKTLVRKPWMCTMLHNAEDLALLPNNPEPCAWNPPGHCRITKALLPILGLSPSPTSSSSANIWMESLPIPPSASRAR